MLEVYTAEDGTLQERQVKEATEANYTSGQYKSRVAELIAEKYSIDDQLAFSLNRMGGWDGSVKDKDKVEEYDLEYFEYQEFRAKCKIQARKDCGIE